MYVCLFTRCVSKACGGRKRASGPWNWTYRQLQATVWVLGIKAGSFLSHRAISPGPFPH